MPGVVGVTTAPLPGYDFLVKSTHEIEGYEGETGGLPWIETFSVDHNFVDLMDISLVSGRNFDRLRPNDESSAVMINRAALHHFNVTDPEEVLGKWVKRKLKQDGVWKEHTYYVIGVLEDFQSWSMRTAIAPIFIYSNSDTVDRFGKVVVKVDRGDVSQTLAQLEERFISMYPQSAFEFSFLDQDIDLFYKADIRQGTLLSIFSGLSVIVACLGLFGLTAFMVVQRRKEIGIRKVLGARVRDVVVMLGKEYIILVGIAFAAAIPVTYVVMTQWLSQFAHSVGIGWVSLLTIGLGAMVLTIATVGYQSIQAALADPARTLHND